MGDEPDALMRALHQAYARPLQSYVVRLTGDHALAQDVVQEAMVRAWKHPEVLAREQDATRAWLYTVVRNLVIDDRRSARHARERTVEATPDRVQPDESQAVLDQWLVSDALAQLSAEHRAVVVGAYYGGRSVAELAHEHQIPEGTVKSRLHYGLRALRLALQERGGVVMTGDDHRYRDWDAAYVLGALSAQDRRAYEEHLHTCDECSAAVAELAGMPGLLRLVPAQEALTEVDDAAAGDVVQLAALAHSARRVHRRRFVALVGAAAVLLVVGGLAGTFLARPAPEATSASVSTSLQLEPVGDVAVTADLTLEKKGWGTRIDWECTYPPDLWPTGDGPTYELVLVDDAGQRTVVATWLARKTGARGLGASSSIVTEDISSVEIRVAGSDTALASART